MYFNTTYAINAETTPCKSLYFNKTLKDTWALDANVNICTSIIRELNDSIKQVKIILLLNDILNSCILFIPLDISNMPITIVLNISGTLILLNIIVGMSENITVYENIYASVFKLPKILIDNSSNGEDIFIKVFEFVFVCCIMVLLYDGVKTAPIITDETK